MDKLYFILCDLSFPAGWNTVVSALQWSRQSVVSFILLVVLCCIGSTIVWIHGQSSQSVFKTYTPPESTEPTLDLSELIPDSPLTLPDSLEFFGKREQYNSEDLYEKINGKAPLYHEAGFLSLTTRRIKHREDPSLWFEVFVYDMGTALNAFSVYSTQKRAGTKVIASLEPHDHYKTENGLYLRHGAYYIECIGSTTSVLLDDALVAIGQDLLTAEPGNESNITERQLFPKENLVPGSFKFILNNAFGSEELQNTFLAKYRLNDQLITAFISKQESSEKASQVAKSYTQFLLDSEGTPDNNVDTMRLVDLYGLLEIVFVDGQYVAGIHEGENRVDALVIAGQIKEALAKININNPDEM